MATEVDDQFQCDSAGTTDSSDFVTTPRAAEELTVSESWLNKARMSGEGPPFYKFGSRVVYSRRELREWAASRRRMSTSIRQTV